MSRESIKQEEEIIETPDEKTIISYDLQIDPRSGVQKKVTKFSTTQQICELCDKYVPRVYECDLCGARVCAKDKRRSPFAETEESQLCLNCYEQDKQLYDRSMGAGGDEKQEKRLERLGRNFG